MPQIGQDVYDELIEFLENQQDADCVGDPPAYKPNKAMSLIMQLEGTTRESAGEGSAVRQPNEESSHLERSSPKNTDVDEILLARARDLLYQAQANLGWISVMDSKPLRQQIKTFLDDTKQPPHVLGTCEDCGHIIVSPLSYLCDGNSPR